MSEAFYWQSYKDQRQREYLDSHPLSREQALASFIINNSPVAIALHGVLDTARKRELIDEEKAYMKGLVQIIEDNYRLLFGEELTVVRYHPAPEQRSWREER